MLAFFQYSYDQNNYLPELSIRETVNKFVTLDMLLFTQGYIMKLHDRQHIIRVRVGCLKNVSTLSGGRCIIRHYF